MFSSIGPGMIIIILVVALLMFGPTKLPELGRAFGKTLREFKNGAREAMDDDQKERKEVGSGEPEKKEETNKRLPD